MSNLQIFKNQDFGEIKVITKGEEPLFLANSLAKSLNYSETAKMLKRLDLDEKIEIKADEVATVLGVSFEELGLSKFSPKAVFITESGLYNAILGSEKGEAKKFKKWVTSEVLPSIRKHGMYAKDELLNNPDLLIQVATELKKEKEEKRLLQEQVKKNKPKVLFADAVRTSHTSILVGELAKILKQNGIDIGQNRLFKWLRENGYLIKRKGTDYNMPTQYSMDLELFEVKETSITHSDGHITVNKTSKVTGKGQVYFINKFIDSKIKQKIACN